MESPAVFDLCGEADTASYLQHASPGPVVSTTDSTMSEATQKVKMLVVSSSHCHRALLLQEEQYPGQRHGGTRPIGLVSSPARALILWCVHGMV